MRNVGKIMVAAMAALSLGACSNSEEPSTVPPGGGPTYPAPEPAAPSVSSVSSPVPPPGSVTILPQAQGRDSTQNRECTAEDIEITGAVGQKPEVMIPASCAAPKTLISQDLQAGSGAGLQTGETVQLNYLMVTWSDKQNVENTYDSGQPLTVNNVGQARVISGWNEGLLGLKQGGRRLLVIPPEKGYGAAGNDGVKPNETLMYVVDAVRVS